MKLRDHRLGERHAVDLQDDGLLPAGLLNVRFSTEGEREPLTLSPGFLRIPLVSPRISQRFSDGILIMPIKFVDAYKIGFKVIVPSSQR